MRFCVNFEKVLPILALHQKSENSKASWLIILKHRVVAYTANSVDQHCELPFNIDLWALTNWFWGKATKRPHSQIPQSCYQQIMWLFAFGDSVLSRFVNFNLDCLFGDCIEINHDARTMKIKIIWLPYKKKYTHNIYPVIFID